jgi:O-antigen/teichoic acid export membrane protein
VFPWQFATRAVMVVTGLTLLLFAHVHGALFYVAWGLIALALVSEGAATLFFWRRSRRRSDS